MMTTMKANKEIKKINGNLVFPATGTRHDDTGGRVVCGQGDFSPASRAFVALCPMRSTGSYQRISRVSL